ncbi:MAG: hypothetical protein U5L45_07945 [Saprospiraceae bacterium]|nr:hypothetical protein [Saprospiraceae bacterium]
MVHFSGFARKMNHILSLVRAKRAREVISLSLLICPIRYVQKF